MHNTEAPDPIPVATLGETDRDAGNAQATSSLRANQQLPPEAGAPTHLISSRVSLDNFVGCVHGGFRTKLATPVL